MYDFDVETYGFMIKVFAPGRKGDSCQEEVGQYLKCWAIRDLVLGIGLKFQGCPAGVSQQAGSSLR